jgi:hypothetical protein
MKKFLLLLKDIFTNYESDVDFMIRMQEEMLQKEFMERMYKKYGSYGMF